MIWEAPRVVVLVCFCIHNAPITHTHPHALHSQSHPLESRREHRMREGGAPTESVPFKSQEYPLALIFQLEVGTPRGLAQDSEGDDHEDSNDADDQVDNELVPDTGSICVGWHNHTTTRECRRACSV